MTTRFTPKRVLPGPIPALAGIGLRAAHHRELLARLPPVGWLEVHSENYFGAGGLALKALLAARNHYPISLHGVGLSLGSTDALDTVHLQSLKNLAKLIEPGLISEHLSWGSVGDRHTNDLLPLPYTEEALRHVCQRIARVQEELGQQILIENVSSYLQFRCSEISEPDFLAAVVLETGCGILLDINNIFVSAMNHGFDALSYMHRIPRRYVREMHLAGHSVVLEAGRELYIDTHSAPVTAAVWKLYAAAVERFGTVPTLVEWDAQLPALDVLLAEADHAQTILEPRHANAA